MIKLSLLNKYTIHKVGVYTWDYILRIRYTYIDEELCNNLNCEIRTINNILQIYLRYYNSCPFHQTFKG